MPMIPTPPIVLHVSKPDYSRGCWCGAGDPLTAFHSVEAAECAIRNKPNRYKMCETCRRQAAKERVHE